MLRFDTPEPITARIDNNAGHVHLVASDRGDTVVNIQPHNESRSEDVRAAASVARQVGYSTPFALSSAFKRAYGVSPKAHRASG
jgi:AraC-like DNA-binding protein